MFMEVTGRFEVKTTPTEYSHAAKGGMQIARTVLDKKFHGDLSGESLGEMLSTLTPVKGSAGYVAMEQFEGSLNGKKGSFVLQHFGIMDKGKPHQNLTVVPDSATGELEGLNGKMTINIKDGEHYYTFDYQL